MVSGESERPTKRQKQDPARAKYRAQAQENAKISASGLQSGDVGVFVTSDKGGERKALRELEGLIEEAMSTMAERAGGDGVGEERRNAEIETGGGGIGEALIGDEARRLSDGVENGADIEKDILAELEELRGGSNKTLDTGRQASAVSDGIGVQDADGSAKPGLITLDIPCVSFVRIPHRSVSSKFMAPVDLVYKICREAHKDPLRPRSRYIKRLTPVSRLRKMMNDGIGKLCEEVLPPVFDTEQGRAWKYAVRVTVRNNNQVSKDDIIKRIAGFVVALGRCESTLSARDEGAEGERRRDGNTSSEDENTSSEDENDEESEIQRKESAKDKETSDKQREITEQPLHVQTVKASALQTLEHKVDLKKFEKLILVEVYRNVVGMSVVGEAKELEEDLKRFNLAEIYAAGRKQTEEDKDEGKEAAD